MYKLALINCVFFKAIFVHMLVALSKKKKFIDSNANIQPLFSQAYIIQYCVNVLDNFQLSSNGLALKMLPQNEVSN